MPQVHHRAENTDADWDEAAALLFQQGVPKDLVYELRATLTSRFEGLLLYGSWARGDADADSDLDVIVFESSGMVIPQDAGRVSVGHYDRVGFQQLSATLFGHHLRRDGVVVLDRSGALAEALLTIEPPASGAVFARVRSLTPVLDVSEQDRTEYLEGLTKVARYLLRSALYAEALDQGRPCFSVREIAVRNQDPSLVSKLSSHASVRPPPSVEVFEELKGRLERLVGGLEENTSGDLHALIEDAWDVDRDLSNFATLALAKDGDELPYDELPKVTL